MTNIVREYRERIWELENGCDAMRSYLMEVLENCYVDVRLDHDLYMGRITVEVYKNDTLVRIERTASAFGVIEMWTNSDYQSYLARNLAQKIGQIFFMKGAEDDTN